MLGLGRDFEHRPTIPNDRDPFSQFVNLFAVTLDFTGTEREPEVGRFNLPT